MNFFILYWDGVYELHSLDLLEEFPPDGLLCASEKAISVNTLDEVPVIDIDGQLEKEIHQHAGREVEGACDAPSGEEAIAFLLANRERFDLPKE
jgi:hypothetical protein